MYLARKSAENEAENAKFELGKTFTVKVVFLYFQKPVKRGAYQAQFYLNPKKSRYFFCF